MQTVLQHKKSERAKVASKSVDQSTVPKPSSCSSCGLGPDKVERGEQMLLRGDGDQNAINARIQKDILTSTGINVEKMMNLVI